jgi:hypothetical protein
MSTSLLYHALGFKTYEYMRTKYLKFRTPLGVKL